MRRSAMSRRRFGEEVRDADVVIVGSCVPEGAAIGEWVTRTARGIAAFYDIDTPVTLAHLEAGTCEYLTTDLVPRYQLYLSSTGGPALERIECTYGSPAARPLYCSFDPALYSADTAQPKEWDLGYLGTYSSDRQFTLERLLNDTARRWGGGRFVVAGPQYPQDIRWPSNVQRIKHPDPSGPRPFYSRQRFTLSIARTSMIDAGYTPSVRLLEAAACGTPIITDGWEGLDTLFEPGLEILLARSSRDALELLVDMSESDRQRIGARARTRVLQQHTSARRATELVAHVEAARSIVSAA